MTLSSKQLDNIAEQKNLKFKDFTTKVPKDCFNINEAKAFGTLIRTLGLIVLFETLLYVTVSSSTLHLIAMLPIMAILWTFIASSFVGLFVIGHDCGHYAFSKHRWLNDFVGMLCHASLLSNFYAWKLGHNTHHQHTQKRGIDPDWPEKRITQDEYQTLSWHEKLENKFGFATPIGVVIGFLVGSLRRSFATKLYLQIKLNKTQKKKLWITNFIFLSLLCVTLGSLIYVAGIAGFFIYYMGPAIIATIMGSTLTLFHHYNPEALTFDEKDWNPVRGHVISTYETKYHPVLEWFWLDINVHLPHHLAPKIPWYHLKPASIALKKTFPEFYQTYDFSWNAMFELWKKPFLKFEQKNKYYEFIEMDSRVRGNDRRRAA